MKPIGEGIDLGRALIVEDDAATQERLARLLVELLGVDADIVIANDISSAKERIAAHKPGVALIDIGLPDGSGNQLMQDLRAGHDLKGIALTGYGTDGDIDSNLAAGFLGHLTKPVTIQALENALIKFGLMEI